MWTTIIWSNQIILYFLPISIVEHILSMLHLNQSLLNLDQNSAGLTNNGCPHHEPQNWLFSPICFKSEGKTEI